VPRFIDPETGKPFYLSLEEIKRAKEEAGRMLERARVNGTADEIEQRNAASVAAIDALIADWGDVDIPELLDEEPAARPTCGAKTQMGTPCRRRLLGNGGRCSLHGGASTGPKSLEGRARVAEAQRNRWATWRARRATDVDTEGG